MIDELILGNKDYQRLEQAGFALSYPLATSPSLYDSVVKQLESSAPDPLVAHFYEGNQFSYEIFEEGLLPNLPADIDFNTLNVGRSLTQKSQKLQGLVARLQQDSWRDSVEVPSLIEYEIAISNYANALNSFKDPQARITFENKDGKLTCKYKVDASVNGLHRLPSIQEIDVSLVPFYVDNLISEALSKRGLIERLRGSKKPDFTLGINTAGLDSADHATVYLGFDDDYSPSREYQSMVAKSLINLGKISLEEQNSKALTDLFKRELDAIQSARRTLVPQVFPVASAYAIASVLRTADNCILSEIKKLKRSETEIQKKLTANQKSQVGLLGKQLVIDKLRKPYHA